MSARGRDDATSTVGARRDDSAPPTVVVMRCDGEAVSLLVDRAGDVIEVEDRDFEEVPETVGAAIRALTVGAYRLDGALLLVLDPDQTLAVTS